MFGFDPAGLVLLVVASCAAGAVNAVAGGGTLLTFPSLLALGLPPVLANATSTVGLTPGSLSGAWGYREDLLEVRQWVPWIVLPSLLGGLLGAFILVGTPPAIFDTLVPVLLLSATALFAAGDWIGRRIRLSLDGRPAGAGKKFGVAAVQLVVSTYGGYFGAGMGILMLAAFSILHLENIHRANGLKTFSALAINVVAAALFVVEGVVAWSPMFVMLVGSVVGGYGGARLAKRVGQRAVRGFVVATGVVAGIVTAVQRWG